MKRDKAPPDPRGGHVRLYNALIDSPAWNALSATDQRAYVALRRALGKTNNGDLSLPLSRARHYRITSPATLAKALRGLVAVGLIAVTRRGGCTRGGQRLPTLYRFTDEAVFEMRPKLIDACKATDDWKLIETIAQGKGLIREAEQYAQARAREKAEKKCLLQSLNDTSTEDVAVKAGTSTNDEAWRDIPLRKLKRGRAAVSPENSCADAGLAHLNATNPASPPRYRK
jgi:hypothetical protein